MKTIYKVFFLFLSILSFPIQMDAQLGEYNALLIPDTLRKNANEVVRLSYTNFSIESPKSATVHVKYVVTLLNEKSDENFQGVHYNKHSKVTKLSAKIYDALGKEIRKVKGKDFVDQSAVDGSTIYNDSRYKSVELYHNSYPYTIELEYTKTIKNHPFESSGDLQSYGTSIEHFKYIVEAPTDLKINYQTRNADLSPSIKTKGNKNTYTWTADLLPAIKYEPFSPHYDKICPDIIITPNTFNFDRYQGETSSWESLGKFMYTINEEQDQLSPEMAKIVKQLIADAQSDKEKIEILYHYLQDNMRYVSVQLGIGGWQAFDAEYVEKNKYGDCKALSNFMKSMLNEVGIESHWALIYSSNRYKKELDPEFATFYSANHMILNIPSEDIWLECTSNDYPVNYLGGGNHDRQALLITKDGGKIKKTPTYGLDQNKMNSTATITINDQGAAVIKRKIEYTGPKHDLLRYFSNNLSPEDLEKRFVENTDLPAFTVDQFKIANDEKQPQSSLDLDISVLRYASKAGRRIFIPLNKLNPFTNVPKAIEKRIHPVSVKNQYREEDLFTFQIPVNYEIESIPNETINLESEFGKYTINITLDAGVVTYKRLLEIYKVELPAERYKDLRTFYKEIAKADGMKMVLVKKKT